MGISGIIDGRLQPNTALSEMGKIPEGLFLKLKPLISYETCYVQKNVKNIKFTYIKIIQ